MWLMTLQNNKNIILPSMVPLKEKISVLSFFKKQIYLLNIWSEFQQISAALAEPEFQKCWTRSYLIPWISLASLCVISTSRIRLLVYLLGTLWRLPCKLVLQHLFGTCMFPSLSSASFSPQGKWHLPCLSVRVWTFSFSHFGPTSCSFVLFSCWWFWTPCYNPKAARQKKQDGCSACAKQLYILSHSSRRKKSKPILTIYSSWGIIH